MFDESLIVQSAVSAFNNAALSLPAFFWFGLLMLPLFFVVYKYADSLMQMLGWKHVDMQSRIIKWTIIMSLVWLVLFSGNYVVLRDSETLLPFVTAGVMCMGMVFVGNITKNIPVPKWGELRKNYKLLLLCMVIFGIVGLMDTRTWWGPVLQIAAFVAGALIGRKIKKISWVPFVSGFLFLFTTMILMQPEFFRFGQLGNLTWLHLLGVLCVGVPLTGSMVLRNTKPTGKIYQSAFIKLKWMMRCLVALTGGLFVMTESVPVFIGVCVLIGGLFWLKIVHSKHVPEHLADRLLLLAVFSFGVLTVMPVISCLAVLGWKTLPNGNFQNEIYELL